jgi:hypothetical protein
MTTKKKPKLTVWSYSAHLDSAPAGDVPASEWSKPGGSPFSSGKLGAATAADALAGVAASLKTAEMMEGSAWGDGGWARYQTDAGPLTIVVTLRFGVTDY